jgi:small-conductance mechanosensitive channel
MEAVTRHRSSKLQTSLLILIISIVAGARPAFARQAVQPVPAQPAADTTAEPAADADQAPTEAPPKTDEPEQPQPIAAADVAPQAEDATTRLRDITKLAEPRESTTAVADKLPGTADEIARLAEQLVAAPPVSLRGVSSARQHWTGLDDLLDGWQGTLQKRLKSLQDAHDELKSIETVWTTTRAGEMPDAVLPQIDSVLAEIETSKAALDARIDEVLTLQGDVSNQRDTTSRVLGQLDELEAELRSNLLVREQEPLWRALRQEGGKLGGEFGQSRETMGAVTSEFLARYQTNFAGHVGIFVLLLAIIWLTRGAVTAGEMEEHEIEHVAIVLARPFSTALLVSILAVRLVYPVASAEILQIGRLIVLVPMLRLLPTLMPKLRSILILLAVVYVMETTSQLALEGSLAQRLILLGSTALGIAVLVAAAIKLRGQAVFDRPLTQRLVRILGWLAALLLLASTVANVAGTVALATLLATATFNAVWAAVAARVLINVLSALLNLVLRSPLARTMPSVRNRSLTIYRNVVGALWLGGGVTWVVLVLDWFQLGAPMWAWVGKAIGQEWAVGTLNISVIGIAAFVIAIVVSLILSRITRFFLEEDVLSRLSLPRGAPATISTLVHYTIVGIGVVIAFAASGMEVSKLGFIVGALSVGIGFGLQNVINNFVSGLILIFERPVKVGDLIEMTDGMGHVTRIGARSSTMKTFAGAEVIIPNGNLISSTVINWTLSDQKRRTEVLIPVPRSADPRRVVEILESVAAGVEEVLEDPAPFVAFQGFDESGMVFAMRAWPAVGSSLIQVQNDLLANALEALREAGIDVPRPQREVHVTRDAETGSP